MLRRFSSLPSLCLPVLGGRVTPMSGYRRRMHDCVRPLAALARVRFRAKCRLERPNVFFPASASYAVFRRPQPRCDVALPCVHDVLSTAGAPKRVPHHYPKDRAKKQQRPEKLCEGDANKEEDSRTDEERIIPAHLSLPLRVLHAYRDQRPLSTHSGPSARLLVALLMADLHSAWHPRSRPKKKAGVSTGLVHILMSSPIRRRWLARPAWP